MKEILVSIQASEWIATFALIVAIISVVVSVRSNVFQRRLERDKALSDQLILTLERAYNSIFSGDVNAQPVKDRLAWLTCARHILTYRKLKPLLSTSHYKILCNEHEEFWRHKFYMLLETINSPSFFSWMDRAGMIEETIEPRSAAVIHNFSSWPSHREDPIDSVDFQEEVRAGKLFSVLFLSFREFIERKFPKMYVDENEQP